MFPLQIKDPKSYVIAGSGSITWTTTNDLVNNVATRVNRMFRLCNPMRRRKIIITMGV